MKLMSFKITLVTLIILVAFGLSFYVIKIGFTPYVIIIASLASVLVMRLLGNTNKKLIVTKKNIIITIALGIITYFILFNVLDLALLNSL